MTAEDKLFVLDVYLTSLTARLKAAGMYTYNQDMLIEGSLIADQIDALKDIESQLKGVKG
jgi:hypothetical protein